MSFDSATKGSLNQTWSTPQDVFDELNQEFHFTLDVCASDHNAKCDRYFTEETDGLAQDWHKNICFMNPPFGNMGAWLRKAYEASQSGATVVCLIKVDTSTKWWHDWATKASEVRFWKKRIKFVPPPNSGLKPGSPNFGVATLIYRPEIKRENYSRMVITV